MDEKTLARFEAKYIPEPNSGCWLWTATLNRVGGYGRFQNKMAHRVSYEHYRGTISSGLELDHLCKTKICVNPYHVEPVSHLVNMQRADGPGRLSPLLTTENFPRGVDHWSRKSPELVARGECAGNAILNAALVLEIRSIYALGETTQIVLGKRYGVSNVTISAIVRRKIWRHI